MDGVKSDVVRGRRVGAAPPGVTAAVAAHRPATLEAPPYMSRIQSLQIKIIDP